MSDNVCMSKRLLSVPGGMWLFSLGKSMPSPSLIWKGTEIAQRPLWWDLMGMMTLQGASSSQGQLGASTQACHTALFGTAPPTPLNLTYLHPQLPCCPALLAALASLGEKSIYFPPLPTAHPRQPDCSLRGGLGCLASWVCSWLNRCTDRDTSVQQQNWPFIFLLWQYCHYCLYWQ